MFHLLLSLFLHGQVLSLVAPGLTPDDLQREGQGRATCSPSSAMLMEEVVPGGETEARGEDVTGPRSCQALGARLGQQLGHHLELPPAALL